MNNLKKLITKYEDQNRSRLNRRPDLTINGDFTPDGIKFFCNTEFINDLKEAINFIDSCTELKEKYTTDFEDWYKTQGWVEPQNTILYNKNGSTRLKKDLYREYNNHKLNL